MVAASGPLTVHHGWSLVLKFWWIVAQTKPVPGVSVAQEARRDTVCGGP